MTAPLLLLRSVHRTTVNSNFSSLPGAAVAIGPHGQMRWHHGVGQGTRIPLPDFAQGAAGVCWSVCVFVVWVCAVDHPVVCYSSVHLVRDCIVLSEKRASRGLFKRLCWFTRLTMFGQIQRINAPMARTTTQVFGLTKQLTF